MQVKLPNFLIVGTAKGGTTSLYYYLIQHPEVYAPHNKEPYFFISSVIERLNPDDPMHRNVTKRTKFSLEDYTKLFEDATKEKALGEASTKYLYYHEVAIPNIRKYLGDTKIIIILRNPVERAFSAYTHLVRDQLESLSFEKCLQIEEERIRENWFPLHFCKDMGFYYKQVKAYLENFNRVKVYLYNDLKEDSSMIVSDIYRFLEVDPSFVPDMNIKHNVSKIPRARVLDKILRADNHPLRIILRHLLVNTVGKESTGDLFNYINRVNLKKEDLKPETRRYLIDLYRDDILKLQDLIKRDLSGWLR